MINRDHEIEKAARAIDGAHILTVEELRAGMSMGQKQATAAIEPLLDRLESQDKLLANDIPAWSMRQAQQGRHTPLDSLFLEAVRAIETWGAHPDLTSAQMLVGRAWNIISRWIEAGASGASEKARAAIGIDRS